MAIMYQVFVTQDTRANHTSIGFATGDPKDIYDYYKMKYPTHQKVRLVAESTTHVYPKMVDELRGITNQKKALEKQLKDINKHLKDSGMQ